MEKYYAYFARCSDNSLYAGYTNDVKKREAQHNDGAGARYTRARRPVKIVYFEVFDTKSAAMKREYEFKAMSKEEKELLIV